LDVNNFQKQNFLEKIYTRFGHNLTGLSFGIWGASCHAKTDDLADSPALSIMRSLAGSGARCVVFDPVSGQHAKQIIAHEHVNFTDDMYLALEGADALVICTDWNQFVNPNSDKMNGLIKSKVIFDGRNILDIDKFEAGGWEIHGIGRGDSL
jgi:UDPglucose 6-dehydrogenase